MKLKTFTDGGARGNPGPAAIGIIIKDEQDKILLKHAEFLGKKTNNQAEYLALLKALELVKKFAPEEVDCFLDSELVVKQMRREYRVRDKDLQPLFIKVWNAALQYKKVSFHHVRRHLNEEADAILNLELDKHS